MYQVQPQTRSRNIFIGGVLTGQQSEGIHASAGNETSEMKDSSCLAHPENTLPNSRLPTSQWQQIHDCLKRIRTMGRWWSSSFKERSSFDNSRAGEVEIWLSELGENANNKGSVMATCKQFGHGSSFGGPGFCDAAKQSSGMPSLFSPSPLCE